MNYAGLGSIAWFINPPGAVGLTTLSMTSNFNIQDATYERERDTYNSASISIVYFCYPYL
jgi:hypothetical protein